ncbi:hypothetical protein Bealeia2_01905 (plasmid) [Candidatus Bealeia paramacronuclearis]|nr:hypothetical protein [Candidatus Bealeia paramacronuclearis]
MGLTHGDINPHCRDEKIYLKCRCGDFDTLKTDRQELFSSQYFFSMFGKALNIRGLYRTLMRRSNHGGRQKRPSPFLLWQLQKARNLLELEESLFLFKAFILGRILVRLLRSLVWIIFD